MIRDRLVLVVKQQGINLYMYLLQQCSSDSLHQLPQQVCLHTYRS